MRFALRPRSPRSREPSRQWVAIYVVDWQLHPEALELRRRPGRGDVSRPAAVTLATHDLDLSAIVSDEHDLSERRDGLVVLELFAAVVPSVEGLSTSTTRRGFVTVCPLRSSGSSSSVPQTTVTSGYVPSPDAVRMRRSELKTRHGLPASAAAMRLLTLAAMRLLTLAAMRLLTLAAMPACAGEPPDIAHTCPARYSCFTRAISSCITYSSNVKCCRAACMPRV